MPLTFDVDGAVTQNPGDEDIARGFGSIKAEGARSVSIIILDRPPCSLTAFGHPKEGYTLDVTEDLGPKEGCKGKVTEEFTPQDEVIRIFQTFARGDDSWQGRFLWTPRGNALTPQVMKRIAIITTAFVLLVLILKYVLKLF